MTSVNREQQLELIEFDAGVVSGGCSRIPSSKANKWSGLGINVTLV